MSATWPWVILGRVPRVVPIPSDADADADAEAFGAAAADFAIAVALPPQVTVLTVAPLAHPDPNYPDMYPYILAAVPDCLLLNFAVEPIYGVNSAVDQHESYLIVERRFRTAGVQQQGHAATFSGERIPGRGADRMPVIYNIESIGLVSFYHGDYMVAELQVDKHSEGSAKLFCFRTGGDRWIQKDLIYPSHFADEDREWIPAGVVAQKTTLWWFDLSWGLLSCDPFVADPVLLFHKLPEDRAVPNKARPDVHTHRCVTVSRRVLRYVEIIPEDSGGCHNKEAATVSMWTRIATPAGWDWEKKYAKSFEDIWDDDTYKETRLPRNVPGLCAVCPSNPDLVYFSLEQEQRLFGVDVAAGKVLQVADKAYELMNMPWPVTASCRYVQAWNLPPWVAIDLELVGSSSSYENEDQAEELDAEELLKLGLKVAMGMDPATLKSEVEKYCEGPPSPEREVMRQLTSSPFDFHLTGEEADADLMEVHRLVKKRRQEK
ncbi:unnamed protein product [Miscanthus lutarioriparius]|uniref:DUF1618 domain-containing protein n=1 Tax=Miscanthus lutarioriparius TaxID=422564 RepID=A0A811S5S4_9POAL|nr:unnamed protein product [Miscanthus lutarioriparius]